jgi:hypothetical protein
MSHGGLGEDLTDLVVFGRVREVDLDGAVNKDRAHLVAQPGFGERVTRGPLGGAAAQLGLVGLVDRRHRDLIDDLDVLGCGRALGYVVGRPSFELVSGQLAAGGDRDEGDGHLAGVGIGSANHGGGCHVRVLEQAVLDRRWVDVVATPDDQVLRAPGKADKPVPVDGREVARVKPAVHDLPVGAHLACEAGADELGSQQQREHLRAVDRDDGDRLAAPHAQPHQHGRRPMHVAGELCERPDEGRVEPVGVGQHRHGRAVGPQLSRPRHKLVGTRRKAALAERDALDVSQVRWTAERWP